MSCFPLLVFQCLTFTDYFLKIYLFNFLYLLPIYCHWGLLAWAGWRERTQAPPRHPPGREGQEQGGGVAWARVGVARAEATPTGGDRAGRRRPGGGRGGHVTRPAAQDGGGEETPPRCRLLRGSRAAGDRSGGAESPPTASEASSGLPEAGEGRAAAVAPRDARVGPGPSRGLGSGLGRRQQAGPPGPPIMALRELKVCLLGVSGGPQGGPPGPDPFIAPRSPPLAPHMPDTFPQHPLS